MALRAKVLRKKAERFERKKLLCFKRTEERVSTLESLLQDVYVSQRPKQSDYNARRDLIRVFNEIAKEIYGNSKDIPVVVEFGSFVMDLFNSTSDLDLSINFRSDDVTFPREKKIQTLRKFARKLYAIQSKGHVSRVLPVTSAKVPILKCVDCGTGVECDLSVENRDGILKSQIIRIISSIDQRFHKLSFLMKTWAKAHNINSSKDKTLNSLSIILLVAFHLQTRNPPILPPFSAIFKDGTDPAKVEKLISKFANYGKRNQESVAELLVTLLIKLSSVEKLWPKGLCASARDATWTSKMWDSKVACISVEDFNDPTQNVARAVGSGEVKQIYKCIDISLQYIFAFMDGQIGVQLKDLLFRQGSSNAPIPTGILNLHPFAQLPPFPSQANQFRRVGTGKRKRQAMCHDSVVINRTIPAGGYPGAQSGGWEQVERNVQLELSSVQKLWVDETWRGNPNASKRQQANGGWDRMHTVGWGVTQRPGAGVWGNGEPARTGGWGGTRTTNAGGWGRTQRSSEGGWQGTQRSSEGGWQGTQRAREGGWGGTQRSSDGTWGETRRGREGGWRGTWRGSEGVWSGVQRDVEAGWGGMQSAGGGGWETTPNPGGRGWGRSWEPSAGGWGGVTFSGNAL